MNVGKVGDPANVSEPRNLVCKECVRYVLGMLNLLQHNVEIGALDPVNWLSAPAARLATVWQEGNGVQVARILWIRNVREIPRFLARMISSETKAVLGDVTLNQDFHGESRGVDQFVDMFEDMAMVGRGPSTLGMDEVILELTSEKCSGHDCEYLFRDAKKAANDRGLKASLIP